MESSLARKRVNPTLSNGASNESLMSPTQSGAMDSLLEKLRAAAPQARDQRDRRRRARLKERHQVRVASGQQIPNLQPGEDEEGEGESTISGQDDSSHLNPQEDENATNQETQISEGEDIADRAANLLQGLRSNMDGDEDRARRRRENAEDERRARRMRMRSRNMTNGSKDSADGSLPSIKEPASPDETDGDSSAQPMSTPAIVVSQSTDHAESEAAEEGSTPDKPLEISD
jgi:cytokinesis protein